MTNKSAGAPDGKRRLFIAAGLPAALREELAAAQRVLAAQVVRIRPTPKEQLHLTLRFIGEAEPAQAVDALRWFRGLQIPCWEPWTVRLAAYGCFLGEGGMTLWAGLECADAVLRMANRLEQGLRGLGFTPETRAFLPHVTLARKAALKRPLEELIELLPTGATTHALTDVTLFESVFTPQGVRHLPLVRILSA